MTDSDGPRSVRPRPCPTCPYRRDVPAGVWKADEYRKLARYDGETFEQSPRTFGCHADEGASLCAGWVGHRDPADLLALRIAAWGGTVDLAVFEYHTDVPLFESGAAAAAHGLARVDDPDDAAITAIHKVMRSRMARGLHPLNPIVDTRPDRACSSNRRTPEHDEEGDPDNDDNTRDV